MADILIVDDDQSVASAFEQFLRYEGYECRVGSSAEDALRLIEERLPSLVIMDIRMPGVDGLQALEQIRSRYPGVYVVMMTAYGTSQAPIEAIRGGAFEYLTKPVDLDRLRAVIGEALAAQRLRDSVEGVEEQAPAPPQRALLVGETPTMLEVYKMIGRLATNEVPALVAGERGTGKRLVVATIHENSARRDRRLVTLEGSALNDAALEDALAQAGTLHVMHVEAMPRPVQTRLVQALGERQARGGAPLGARVLASTEADLVDDVRAGRVSRELADLLGVVTIALPPLRSRRDDIPLLARYFIQRFNVELNRTIRGVDEPVLRRLQAHAWPGNVGELERVIKRACIVARGDAITADDIGDSLAPGRFGGADEVESSLARAAKAALHERLVERGSGEDASPFHAIVDFVETALVNEAMTIVNGNQVKAADLLGVNRATLRKKI